MSDNDQRDNPDIQLRSGQPLFLHRQVAPDRLAMTDQRAGREIFAPGQDATNKSPAANWDALWSSKLDHAQLLRNGLFTDPTTSEIAGYFDLMRARLLHLLSANNWSRIAVTSATPGCGKTFVAANLALSLARLPACRTLLIDLDLRSPHLASTFNRTQVPPLARFLLGLETMESQLQRLGLNLAVALNGEAVLRPYEILQDPVAIQTLNQLQTRLQPDVTIMDLPPALESDDVLAMAPHLDAIILVVDGTMSTPDDIHRCTAMLDGQVPLAGVVLNKAQDRGLGRLRRRRRSGAR